MPLREKAAGMTTRSIDVANKTADVIVLNLDLITSLSCVVAALACVYLIAIILREHTPLVHLQRVSLGLLSMALLANALYDIPNWMLIEGHRPTGAAVDFMLMINVVVMCIRGSIMYQPRRKRQNHREGVIG